MRLGISSLASVIVLAGSAALLADSVGAQPDRDPAPAQAPATTSQPPRTLALLVGCTEYPDLRARSDSYTYENYRKLKGPQHDVALLRDILVARFGATAADITELVGWPATPSARPTHDNIVGHLERLASAEKGARQGDRVVVLLAGHGTQQPDASGDEADGLDEEIGRASCRERV